MSDMLDLLQSHISSLMVPTGDAWKLETHISRKHPMMIDSTGAVQTYGCDFQSLGVCTSKTLKCTVRAVEKKAKSQSGIAYEAHGDIIIMSP